MSVREGPYGMPLKTLLKPAVSRLYYPVKRFLYGRYSSEEFRKTLLRLGIHAGDSLFVMCSANNAYKKTGYRLPVHEVLKDLMEMLGPNGTVLTLAFSNEREKIVS